MATANDHVEQLASEDDDESRSDMAEFGEFDLSGARNQQITVAGYRDDDEWASEEEDDDDESGSDMEFGEFDLSGARNLRDQQTLAAAYEDDDDDDADGCGPQFSVRPYYRGGVMGRNLQLSGFQARSDGPELTEQHELTSYDMRRLVRLALEGGEGESMEDDEAYQRALAGGTPVSRVARAAMVGQALQSTSQQQQSKPPSQIFPMRTGY